MSRPFPLTRRQLLHTVTLTALAVTTPGVFAAEASGRLTVRHRQATSVITPGEHVLDDNNGRRAILYYDTGVSTTSRLVGFSDNTGADYGNVAGALDVAFNASGIYTCSR